MGPLAAVCGVARTAGRACVFVAGGIAVVIVGSFMIRGAMRMWDRADEDGRQD